MNGCPRCGNADPRPEHHGTEDGYLPSPLALAGCMLGRTRRIRVSGVYVWEQEVAIATVVEDFVPESCYRVCHNSIR